MEAQNTFCLLTTSVAIGLTLFNFRKISYFFTNYFINYLCYKPGVGNICMKNYPSEKFTKYCVEVEDFELKLNYIKLPSLDTNVYFFKGDIKYDDKLMDHNDFLNNYGSLEIICPKTHGLGIIEDNYHTANIKKGKLYGYLEDLIEYEHYIFEIEEGPIDLRKVFKEYEDFLGNVSVETPDQRSNVSVETPDQRFNFENEVEENEDDTDYKNIDNLD